MKKKHWIIILSIVIPLAVSFLLSIDKVLSNEQVEMLRSFDSSYLPPVYAGINALTAVLLFLAVRHAKNKNIAAHQATINMAMLCSVLFLLMYEVYHLTSQHTLYGDVDHNGIVSAAEAAKVSGSIGIYKVILFSHIALSAGIIPLVLFSYLYGSERQVVKHRKIVKFAFPLWMYVAVTGVVIYFMISPYYA